jgi:N-acetylglucosaminyldiphosphoundecaprenol N-acetyl-beta-D-mannosaminyltransferase
MIDQGRHPVLGIGVNAMDIEAAVEAVARAGRDRRPLAVSCSAVHSIMEGALDPEHRHRLNALDLVLPDGQPVRWALRWRHGVKLPGRVYGPDFMLALCERAERDGIPIYLYGSRSETLAELSAGLTRRFPGLRIAGARPSAFRAVSEDEQKAIAAEIRESGAGIVFAGLGCPRQEIWAYENSSLISLPIIAVGAAFDFHAGLLPQAPRWMQRSGTEWVFRLGQEPRRLWKRYLYLNPLYLLFLAGEALGIARFGSGIGSQPRRVRVG